ncbi:MAG: deoxyguanosinetriphosphate triphosphohydrolase [Candidatus Hydrogenedens sp.]|nr:deoxyguanosinetriphosphate triphosphohydrolase [Candidatus Hydrogenedens sp.]
MASIRAALEAREEAWLSPFAQRVTQTQGRRMPEEEDAVRTAYQRDRDRILHSKAFRRLKRKTQVFLAPEGDHYRTRLTHTLEVMQISRTVVRALHLNEDLVEAITLGHDLGHTPFGHAGERILDEVYSEGFRHFEQSLRVVDKLEHRGAFAGLNLTHEVRDGILHHSRGKAVLQGKVAQGPNTLEGQVMSICDAVAYVNHDIDDAVRAGVLDPASLPRDAVALLGDTSSKRIDRLVLGIIQASQEGRIGIEPDVLEALNELRDFLFREVYPCDVINDEMKRAGKLLRELYYDLLERPVDEILNADPEDSLERRTVDFVAGMTDNFAMHLYETRMLPAPWKG